MFLIRFTSRGHVFSVGDRWVSKTAAIGRRSVEVEFVFHDFAREHAGWGWWCIYVQICICIYTLYYIYITCDVLLLGIFGGLDCLRRFGNILFNVDNNASSSLQGLPCWTQAAQNIHMVLIIYSTALRKFLNIRFICLGLCFGYSIIGKWWWGPLGMVPFMDGCTIPRGHHQWLHSDPGIRWSQPYVPCLPDVEEFPKTNEWQRKNQWVEDVFLVENGDFPAGNVSFRGCKTAAEILCC